MKALAAFAQIAQAAERAAASVRRVKRVSPMKLYIFEDVLADHTPGLAVALARTKRQAINVILDRLCGQLPPKRSQLKSWREHRRMHEKDLRSGSCTIKTLDQPYAVAVHGGS